MRWKRRIWKREKNDKECVVKKGRKEYIPFRGRLTQEFTMKKGVIIIMNYLFSDERSVIIVRRGKREWER